MRKCPAGKVGDFIRHLSQMKLRVILEEMHHRDTEAQSFLPDLSDVPADFAGINRSVPHHRCFIFSFSLCLRVSVVKNY